MIDFAVLTEHFTLVVLVACLVVGYIIKTCFNFIPNKYIPALLAVLGAVLNPIAVGLTLETVVYGALTGLASTGLHQAFKQFVEKPVE